MRSHLWNCGLTLLHCVHFASIASICFNVPLLLQPTSKWWSESAALCQCCFNCFILLQYTTSASAHLYGGTQQLQRDQQWRPSPSRRNRHLCVATNCSSRAPHAPGSVWWTHVLHYAAAPGSQDLGLFGGDVEEVITMLWLHPSTGTGQRLLPFLADQEPPALVLATVEHNEVQSLVGCPGLAPLRFGAASALHTAASSIADFRQGWPAHLN